ncbi:MAG: chromosomal replication initiator protein DnaA [Candidatus Paceibacterota bacterium]
METYEIDSKDMWGRVLVEAELNVPEATFNTWFKDTFIARAENGVVYIGVPNEFVKTWLKEKYHKFILKTLRENSEHVRGVEYIIAEKKQDNKKKQTKKQIKQQSGGLPLSDLYINKDDNLNPRYTFNSFIVGPFNELAYAATQAILKNLGGAYNPLFVYGKTGVGKTHLIQAVGNKIKESHPSAQVFYLTSEKFAVDYINSVQNNTVNIFKEKYRKYDLLIMDDIQFLSKKEKTQEELFHLFNTLYDRNKQIIFSSDVHPNHLSDIEDRLQSRFSAGMIVDIPQPEQESRIAILRAKVDQTGVSVKDEVIEHLAEVIASNIRELEGALNTIIMQSELKQKELSLQEVKKLIQGSVKTKKAPAIKDVVKCVANFYSIDEELIHKKTRKKEIVLPRQIIMYILREDYAIPYPTIGQKIGGRDHTTVIHSYEKIKKDLKSNSTLSHEIDQIRAILS